MGSLETVDHPSFEMAINAVMQPTQSSEFLLRFSMANLICLFLCLLPTNKLSLNSQRRDLTDSAHPAGTSYFILHYQSTC